MVEQRGGTSLRKHFWGEISELLLCSSWLQLIPYHVTIRIIPYRNILYQKIYTISIYIPNQNIPYHTTIYQNLPYEISCCCQCWAPAGVRRKWERGKRSTNLNSSQSLIFIIFIIVVYFIINGFLPHLRFGLSFLRSEISSIRFCLSIHTKFLLQWTYNCSHCELGCSKLKLARLWSHNCPHSSMDSRRGPIHSNEA